MLKKIKNFFKWIADHTGISWILGKLGWKSHQFTDQEENFVIVPKEQNAVLKFVDGKVKLATSTKNYETLQAEFKNTREDGTIIDNEFRLNLSDDKQLYITGCYDSKMTTKNGNICLSINSVGTLDGKEVYGDNEPEKMKELLDLSDKKYIKINSNVPKVTANGDVVSSGIANTSVTPVAGTGQSISQ